MSLQKIKYVISFILILWLHSASSEAQVTVEAKLDSAGIFIGQRIGLTLEVTSDAGKEVELPEWDSLQLVEPGLEFVRADKPDTSYLNDGKRMVLTRRYFFT